MTKDISPMKRWMAIAAAAALGAWALPAGAGTVETAATDKEVADKMTEAPVVEEEIFNNWAEVGFGYNFVNHNDAQFQQRFGVPADHFYGGIQDLHMEQGLGGGLLSIDGRFIYDNMDNLIDIKYENSKWGYVNVGYEESRTYYDGSGGYYPGSYGNTNRAEYVSKDWFDLYNDDLHIDRGKLWFEFGLNLPDLPQVTFRYQHDWRDGQKGSTIWGDSGLTGGEYQQGGRGFRYFGTRAYLPTMLDIDEVRDTFDLDVTHGIGNTRFGIGGTLELLEQDNARYTQRRPGERGIKQEGATSTRYDVPIERKVTQRETVESDMWNAHAFTETTFNEMFTLTTGGSFTAMDTDIGGSRIYASEYDQDYDAYYRLIQQRDEGFYNLAGGAFLKQYVGNVNLIFTPFEHLTIVPSVRLEFQDRDSVARFIETNFLDQKSGKNTYSARAVPAELRNMSTREDVELTESLEIRYSGVPDWVFYVRGEWSDGQTHLKESDYEISAYEYDGAPFESGGYVPEDITTLYRDTNSDRFMQKYVGGFNWYPCPRVTVSGQYYFKEKNIDYDFLDDTAYYHVEHVDGVRTAYTGDLYPAFIREEDFRTHDLNVRLTWRPCGFLTSVSRYDLQHSTIDTRGDFAREGDYDDSAMALDSIETAQMDSHIFSQSFTIIPCSRMYLQAYGTYAFNELETPVYGRELAGDSLISPTALDSGYLTIVGQSRNSYWTAGALMGITVDDKTSVQCQYGFYQSDNWVNNYYASMPYGSEGEEHTISATINRQLTKNLSLTLRYGYVDYKDVTSGENNNFDAHMTYAGLKMRW